MLNCGVTMSDFSVTSGLDFIEKNHSDTKSE